MGMTLPVESAPKPTEDSHIEKVEEDVEVAPAKSEDGGVLEPEPKAYYSRLSVWLMILFSGLAIGSDG